MKTISDILTETPDATDADILAAIDASREWRRVPVGEVKLWLLANNLLGVLYYVRDTSAEPALKAGLSEFLAGLTLYESIDASDEAIRTKAIMLTGALAQAKVISADQLASFMELLKEPSTTSLADVARYRRQILAQPQLDAAGAKLADLNAFVGSVQDWIATGAGEMPAMK